METTLRNKKETHPAEQGNDHDAAGDGAFPLTESLRLPEPSGQPSCTISSGTHPPGVVKTLLHAPRWYRLALCGTRSSLDCTCPCHLRNSSTLSVLRPGRQRRAGLTAGLPWGTFAAGMKDQLKNEVSMFSVDDSRMAHSHTHVHPPFKEFRLAPPTN